jgi:trimethylamine--corrinoid protein Co-methyltransferase
MSIAGVMTVQNVELLAGITLAQMINPGNPVVYGAAASITDMKTAGLALGSPEYAKLVGIGAQMARYYELPSRGGGALTDSLMVDTQAGYESMMIFMSAINHGMNFVLHSAGILDSYMTMSYEKFMIDSEIIGMVKDYQAGVEVNKDTVAQEVINMVGPGGDYLTEAHTMKHMKDFRETDISSRGSYSSEDELIPTVEQANKKWQRVLSDFKAPYLDSIVDKKLNDYIENL